MITRSDSAVRRCGSRLGLTLIELLVVISLIAILLSLFTPFLRTSREGTRRAHCQRNLKVLGHAAYDYYDAFESFPAAVGDPRFAAAGIPENRDRLGGIVLLLPYLEQTSVWEAIQNGSSQNGQVYPAFGPRVTDSGFSPWQHRLERVICPSSFKVTSATTNYAFCIGQQSRSIHQDKPLDSMFGFRRRCHLGMISDGSSNTMMMAEISAAKNRSFASGWVTGVDPSRLDRPQTFADTLVDSESPESYRPDLLLSREPRGARWFDGAAGSSLFHTTLLPNRPSFSVGDGPMNDGVYSAGSAHPGTTTILRADGSIESFWTDSDWTDSDQDNLAVWQALGTIAGRDRIDLPDD